LNSLWLGIRTADRISQQILFDLLVIPYDAVKFLLSGRKDERDMFAVITGMHVRRRMIQWVTR
jgi:hypothetical protein